MGGADQSAKEFLLIERCECWPQPLRPIERGCAALKRKTVVAESVNINEPDVGGGFLVSMR